VIRKRTISMLSPVAAAVAAAALALAAPTVRAETPAEFYKGGTIDLYVGVSAGGIYSTGLSLSYPSGPACISLREDMIFANDRILS
jgi:hypothetical protein